MNLAVSLLYATDGEAITIAYSQKGCWMKAVEEDAEDYDHEKVKQNAPIRQTAFRVRP